MIKKLLLPFILFCAFSTNAQNNNSWIDYSKTYFKFKIASDLMVRIPQSTLAAVGLTATNADYFQLWRNGQQIRLFTPVAGVALGASDYIEFWGEMNDGKADSSLYKEPQFQLANRYSLETDTSTYFLTVNPAGGNLRYATSTNTAPSAATPDAYFMRKIDVFYKSKLNLGFARDLGEYVYSSAYDNGEGFTSNEVYSSTNGGVFIPGVFTENITGLNVYTAGPINSLSVRGNIFSNTDNVIRTLSVKLFNTQIANLRSSNTSNANINSINLPLSYLQNTSNVPISISNISSTNPDVNDRLVVATLGITYPATFNFNNSKSFYFELAASSNNYLVIDNFNYGSIAPILYDINSGFRYTGDIVSTPGKVKFVLPASTDAVRKFLLNNVESSNIAVVNNLVSKNFVNYNTATTRGDFIIISNPVLYNDGAGVNNVELYRSYRSSANGGGFNAKVYDINELTDQFGFGIKSHPESIRDFVRFMDAQYPVKAKYIFLIGRGVSYLTKRPNESSAIAAQLDLVGTFGWPASDVLLVSQANTVVPITPVGRLGAINGAEVGIYYQKVLQYEQQQRTQSPLLADKGWMKNFLHLVGGKTEDEKNYLQNLLNQSRDIAMDTLMGANVENFSKTSVATTQQESSTRIAQLFQEGLGFVGYFGHSSANSFEFNITTPENYNNLGKYPFFNASGCIAGDYYSYDPLRLSGSNTLSERYTFANQRGSICFLADTHFGVPYALSYYNNRFYENFSKLMYGSTVGLQLKEVSTYLDGLNPAMDYITRIHLEEINLQGDPFIKINTFPKADFVIEDPSVVITPSVLSVSDISFKVKVNMRNIGKAVGDSIRVSVKRMLPNNSVAVILKDTLIKAIVFVDSLSLTIPINPSTDKGANQIIVELDATNRISEIYETNNKVTKDFFIFENTLNPVYPYNYSIVNNQNITFSASTANPIVGLSNFVMEIDTTELFNSAFKKTYNISSIGGVIQFNPSNIIFSDSTVYYWRTAVVATNGNNIWNTFSFVYLPTSTAGFNQSHYFQYLKSAANNLTLDNDRIWKYTTYNSAVTIYNGVFPTAANQAADFRVNIDGVDNIQSVCGISKIIINAISPSEMVPILNSNTATGQYGSDNICGSTRKYNFQFNILSQAKRDSARKFLDLIPQGYYVVVRNTSGTAYNSNTYATEWQADGANSMYSRLKDAGFADIDSFNRPRAFNFIYRKGISSFLPVSKFSVGVDDKIVLAATCPAFKANGEITSPVFGPAKKWEYFHWRGKSLEMPTADSIKFDIVGVSATGSESILFTVDSTMKDVDISSINAATYPYIKLKMYNIDRAASTPYQLQYLRLNYTPVPEGAVAPNIKYTMKDTVDIGEPINFSVAFKNISAVKFDSLMKINLKIRTANNVDSIINIPKGKILIAGDTLIASYTIASQNYLGKNTLLVDFNPNNNQLEQAHFNNILYKDFFVKQDLFNPLLDVTFDGVHILSKDIVASKPAILIKLKDESKSLALRDTALLKVQLRYPDQTLRTFHFGDTMRFNPANLTTGENAATIDFKPFLPVDGDYELIVSGKDVSGNTAGVLNHRSVFSVINKPMISELLNYPNPFTTSTAFVFTLTGSQIPQNMRIQVLTITGKVVREITKEELGPIHIGRNITEFKWDGTDMYGQKLANGVYIYRVITNLNGKSLEKYKADGDNTSKFFNKGYGKMYLMR